MKNQSFGECARVWSRVSVTVLSALSLGCGLSFRTCSSCSRSASLDDLLVVCPDFRHMLHWFVARVIVRSLDLVFCFVLVCGSLWYVSSLFVAVCCGVVHLFISSGVLSTLGHDVPLQFVGHIVVAGCVAL